MGYCEICVYVEQMGYCEMCMISLFNNFSPRFCMSYGPVFCVGNKTIYMCVCIYINEVNHGILRDMCVNEANGILWTDVCKLSEWNIARCVYKSIGVHSSILTHSHHSSKMSTENLFSAVIFEKPLPSWSWILCPKSSSPLFSLCFCHLVALNIWEKLCSYFGTCSCFSSILW